VAGALTRCALLCDLVPVQAAAARSSMSADAQAHRRAAVEKFRQKRKQRTFEKKVRGRERA
jgi:hypothetical protein